MQNSPDNRDPDEYSTLLDTVFPRDFDGTQYAFAVRLEPSFGLESQLVVKVLPDDSVSAELFQVAARSAWEALSDKEQPGPRVLSITELAKTITVQTRTVDLDREIAHGWQMSLLDAIRTSAQALEAGAREDHISQIRTIRVVADGFGYRIWYSQGSVNLQWDFVDVGPDRARSTPVLPLIRWIADVMEIAERKAARE